MPSYAPPSIAFAKGKGTQLWDADGKQYLDFVSGVAVNALGHGHPAVIEAVTRQVQQLGHVSNLYTAEPPIALAERLLDLAASSGSDGRVFFCNSGAEANEAAFKIARLTGRPKIVSMLGSFHGRTMGALAMTGQTVKHSGFEPLPSGVTFVPYGDVDALRNAVDRDTAAVILEPIQGEYGVAMPPDGFLSSARQITETMGSLLIVDEVQTGTGRTGDWFGHQASGIRPDVITLAKGIGGGLPLGACIGFGNAGRMFSAGKHASTFGGNPVACAAGLAVIDTIVADDLLRNARDMGDYLQNGIRELEHRSVTEVRGRGLLIGMVLDGDRAGAVQEAAQRHGLLVNAVQPGVVRLAPPLIVEKGDVEAFLDKLPAVLDEAT